MARLLLTYVLLITCFLLGGCIDDRWERGYMDAYVPVYNADPVLKQISYLPAKKTINGGKLYTYSFYVLQEEADSGLHLISYQDPAHPVKTGFLRIPGFRKAMVEGAYLYADNFNDLVVIPLNELPSLTHVGRVPGAWTQKDFPPFRDVYFECVDPSKGTVIGWTKKKMDNPKCRTMGHYYSGYGDERPRLSVGMVAKGGNIYFADNADLVSYSIAQPLAPVFKHRLGTGHFMDSLYVLNNHLATTDMKYSGLSLYDISDPAQIQYRVELSQFSSCQLLLDGGHYVYAVNNPLRNQCSAFLNLELSVYELQDDYTIISRNSLRFDTTYSLASSGNYVYAGTNKGVTIVDISATPDIQRFVDKPGDLYTDITIAGSHLFCRSRAMISCYDISAPVSIKLLSKFAY
jgi:hypothetical protein